MWRPTSRLHASFFLEIFVCMRKTGTYYNIQEIIQYFRNLPFYRGVASWRLELIALRSLSSVVAEQMRSTCSIILLVISSAATGRATGNNTTRHTAHDAVGHYNNDDAAKMMPRDKNTLGARGSGFSKNNALTRPRTSSPLDAFKVGEKVRVITNITAPRCSFASVKPLECGTITDVGTGCGSDGLGLTVDFESFSGWKAYAPEMEHCFGVGDSVMVR
eukprot:SAG11_NODE_12199_length_716_cov_1.152350_1_plen_217_part_10